MIVYVCGSYKSRWGLPGILWHIWKARKVAIRLSNKGFTVFTPHLNWMLFDGHMNRRFWLDCGLTMLEKCHAIYLMKGWHKSEGSIGEVSKALGLGLQIMREEE